MAATPRVLGTMVVYGGPRNPIGVDLEIAHNLGASVVEILPDWKSRPDPVALRSLVADHGMTVWSAHGCWGGQSIQAHRVDLGSLDPETRSQSLADIRRCLDWLAEAGGSHLVIHPGGLADEADFKARQGVLRDSLHLLADHARPLALTVCVENMPPGVHPGSIMADLFDLVAEIDRDEVGLTLDTGHAHLNGSLVRETRSAGRLLRTTHVHDNNGRSDTHLPPGLGTIDWPAWRESLDTIRYSGPIMLECIRHLRENPESLGDRLRGLLTILKEGGPQVGSAS